MLCVRERERERERERKSERKRENYGPVLHLFLLVEHASLILNEESITG